MSTGVHQFEDKLLEFAYGELPRPEAEAVEVHLRGCARCARSVEEIRSVRSVMGALPMEAAPDAGLESLLAYAEQAARRNEALASPRPFWSRWILPLASVTAMALVGVFAWRTREAMELDPVAVAAGMKKAEVREKSQVKEAYRERAEAPVPAPAQAVPSPSAQPVAPVVAAQPEAPQEQRLSEEDYLNSGSKMKTRSAPTPKPQTPSKPRKVVLDEAEAPASSLPADEAPRRDSLSRKQAVSEEKAARTDEAQANKVGSRGVLNEGAGVAQALEGNAVGGTLRGGGTGLGTGAGSLGTLGTGVAGKGDLAGSAAGEALAAKDSPAPKKGSSGYGVSSMPPPAPAPEPTTVARAEPKPAPPAAPSQGPAAQGSMPLGLGRGRSAPSSSADQDADAVVEANVDRKQANDDAAFDRRVRAEKAARLASEAKGLLDQGSFEDSARLAIEALSAGAEGASRLEALATACESLEALGQGTQARPYCVAVQREFPTSVAARQAAQRQRQADEAASRTAPASKKKAAPPAATKSPAAE